MKSHFFSSLIFAGLLGFMAKSDSLKTRMILLVASLVMFYATWLFFMIEYNKINTKQWKKKEKKIIESTYSKFVSEYHKGNPQKS